jgi:outer membrane protein TolC
MRKAAFALSCLLSIEAVSSLVGSAETSLTLQEAVATALERHPTLRIGEAELLAAQQRVNQRKTGDLPHE